MLDGNTLDIPPVTPSPGITTATMADKKLAGNDGMQEDNNRKRKRDLDSEENVAKDTRMVLLPFEKKLPIWKRFEAMEVFKTFPHFSPLLETRKEFRETYAVGMMFTFSSLVEAVKGVQAEDPIDSLSSLKDCFSELKKYGFDVKEPELQISKLLSLRDWQAKEMEGAEKDRIKVENEQRLKEEAVKEIAEMVKELQLECPPWVTSLLLGPWTPFEGIVGSCSGLILGITGYSCTKLGSSVRAPGPVGDRSVGSSYPRKMAKSICYSQREIF
ncbi:unnamed protein product [Microthlaspi erraticum]|uniref:Uncharacterized protein n=1 Tax=Microthlaspi erraticum TaxID=1685480 RepID=A0A6D2J501_9BRAS|nr:unnamed protein product [Microthlaspi erraticum]